MATTVDDLVTACSKNEDDSPLNDLQLMELARCAEVNLEHMRPILDRNPLLAIGWSQAMAVCKVVIKKFEDEDS